MVQMGTISTLVPLVNPKVELCKDVEINSPGASLKLNYRTISAHRSASNRGMESHYGCLVNFDGG